MDTMKDGDVFEVIKDWDLDLSPSNNPYFSGNAWRRARYYKGKRITVGAYGEETQLPYWKYPQYFKKVDETNKHNTNGVN